MIQACNSVCGPPGALGSEGVTAAASRDGASTFAGTRLDDWQVNDDRNLYIGNHGISIRVDPTKSSIWADAGSQPLGDLPSHKLEELRSALNETEGLFSETEWWDTWKGLAATVLADGGAGTKARLHVPP